MNRYFILVLPNKNMNNPVELVVLQVKESKIPKVFWKTLEEVNTVVDELTKQHPEHIFIYAASTVFQEMWKDDATPK